MLTRHFLMGETQMNKTQYIQSSYWVDTHRLSTQRLHDEVLWYAHELSGGKPICNTHIPWLYYIALDNGSVIIIRCRSTATGLMTLFPAEKMRATLDIVAKAHFPHSIHDRKVELKFK